MEVKFNFYADSGHGWLKVKHQDVIELGIKNEISSFSYSKNKYDYLEEDCDASLFIKAYKEDNPNVEVKFNEHHSNRTSFVRGLERYSRSRLR